MPRVFDSRESPLVRVVWPTETDDEFLRSMERELVEILDRGERFAMLTICPADLRVPNAKHRAEIARVQRETSDRLTRFCIADAMVLPSPMQRGVVTVLNWLAPSKHPQEVFNDVDAALAWVARRFADAGLPWKSADVPAGHRR